MFITDEDYRVVIGEAALKTVSQTSAKNRANAESEAQEEISSYLRPVYDCKAVFDAEGDERNKLIVMYTCDIALYHMVSVMPQKYGASIGGAGRSWRPAVRGFPGTKSLVERYGNVLWLVYDGS